MNGAVVQKYLAAKRGERILDLGCGAGRDLAFLLGSTPVRKVVGLDISEDRIAAAGRRLGRHARQGRAEALVSDAGEPLPFPSKSFHAVMSVDLLECLPESKQGRLLKEIHRVLKPGGRTVLVHADWDTQLWNASDPSLERRLVHAFCDWKQAWMGTADGWMGRRLLGLVRKARRFKGVQVVADVLIDDRYTRGAFGYQRSRDLLDLARKTRSVRSADVQRFLSDLRRLDRAGVYFYSVNRYVVMARKRR